MPGSVTSTFTASRKGPGSRSTCASISRIHASDEHRLGLKPVTRRVWAPAGERPVARNHHRSQWLHVAASVAPATGETAWYLSTGPSEPFFERLLAEFAREAGAGGRCRAVVALENLAGTRSPT